MDEGRMTLVVARPLHLDYCRGWFLWSPTPEYDNVGFVLACPLLRFVADMTLVIASISCHN